MREFKFRMWMKVETWQTNVHEPTHEMVYDIAYDEYEPLNDLLNETKNLMQYTGLKDKNGVEIYEGDIGKTPFGETYIVKFDGGSFYPHGWYPLDMEDVWWMSFEVIGNIYENPELVVTDER